MWYDSLSLGKEKDGCQLLAESLNTECLSCCTEVVMPEIFQSRRGYNSASFAESQGVLHQAKALKMA